MEKACSEAISNHKFGRLLISSPQGRSGKTIVTVGLISSLLRKGLVVQPFKKGPDYIDPSWLSEAARRTCRNLDLFLMSEKEVMGSFQKACMGADIAVIEGAMGLFDGIGPFPTSSADLASLLGTPVIMVVNTERMTESIAALVSGYQRFRSDVEVAGVILNNVAGARHEAKLKDAIERYCGIPVLGSIQRDNNVRIDERHLGLVPAWESSEARQLIDRIAYTLGPCLDVEGMVNIAHSRNRLHPCDTAKTEVIEEKSNGPRIGVFFDRAFNFYYPENLEALVAEGARLIYIDSFRERLPSVDGLYIGGGFPELFLDELEANRDLITDVRRAVEDGLPVYAECGGLMYLCGRIHGRARSYEMAGIIPGEVTMLDRPQGHGYVEVEVSGKNPFFPCGSRLRGHEFHHSALSLEDDIELVFRMIRGRGIDGKGDGISFRNVLACYTHIHALGNPGWARRFVSLAAGRFEDRRSETSLNPGIG